MNGIIWTIIFVDPNSPVLIDRTGSRTVACTDPISKNIYISNEIRGDFYVKVLLHELGHCAMVSYGLLNYIHSHVEPENWIMIEEFMCNFLADYGFKIFTTAENLVRVDLV